MKINSFEEYQLDYQKSIENPEKFWSDIAKNFQWEKPFSKTLEWDFNDYSVQKEFLADYEKKHKRSVELSAAINGLIAVLHQKQLHERTRVQQAFADFNQDAVREKFSELFSSQNQPEAGK